MEALSNSRPALARRSRRFDQAVSLVLFAALVGISGPSFAQAPKAGLREKLEVRHQFSLRDTNFVQAMFALGKLWGVDIVCTNDLKDETINCEFDEATLSEILDSILIPRGYAYRAVGKSIVILKADLVGEMRPNHESAFIPIDHANIEEVKETASLFLSAHGQLKVLANSKLVVVVDTPQRIETIRKKIELLEESSRRVTDSVPSRPRLSDSPSQGRESTPLPSGAASERSPVAEPSVAIFHLEHVKVENIAPSIAPLLSSVGRVSVVTKENRLIVLDVEDRLALIRETVERIDVPRNQVRITTLIYDASLQDMKRFGINWNMKAKGRSLDAQSVAKDSVGLVTTTAANPAATATNGALTFTTFGSNLDLTAVVNALSQSKQSRLLADPQVTVYDQEEANIAIVTEVPFQQLTQGGLGGAIGTTAFREAGVSLKVTPQIGSADDTITMVVNPKFSVLTGFTPNTNAPILDRRETSTTVRVRNHETLVIGGLRKRDTSKTGNGIPYLKDIRVIGELFKYKEVDARESELIVFITPEILEDYHAERPRQQIIQDCSEASLESVPFPRTPDLPCQPEEWRHRCGLGCKCKHCVAAGGVGNGAPRSLDEMDYEDSAQPWREGVDRPEATSCEPHRSESRKETRGTSSRLDRKPEAPYERLPTSSGALESASQEVEMLPKPGSELPVESPSDHGESETAPEAPPVRSSRRVTLRPAKIDSSGTLDDKAAGTTSRNKPSPRRWLSPFGGVKKSSAAANSNQTR